MSHPQHLRSPLSRMAQVWLVPAATETAVLSIKLPSASGVLRSTGVEDGEVVYVVESWVVPPSPSCPRSSDPQHLRSPLSRMAQVWR